MATAEQPTNTQPGYPCHSEPADFTSREKQFDCIAGDLETQITDALTVEYFETGGKPLAELHGVGDVLAIDIPYQSKGMPLELSGELDGVKWLAECDRDEPIVIHRTATEPGQHWSDSDVWIRLQFTFGYGE